MVTIAVPSDGDDIVTSWGQDVAEAINATVYDEGYNPGILSQGTYSLSSSAAAVDFAAVSGGNGGGCLIPFVVTGPARLVSYTIWNTDTASARSAEARLYRDQGASLTLAYVEGTADTFSFTPGSAAARTSAGFTAVTLLPGTYHLVIRNTSASQTFGIGRTSTSTLGATMCRYVTTASVAALGSTISASTFSTASTSSLLAQLRCQVFTSTTY